MDAIRHTMGGLGRVAPALAVPIASELFFATSRFKPHPNERRVLAKAETMSVEFEGRRLAGWVWPGRGPLVLLVHGWNGRAGQLAEMVAPLREKGHRVAAFDLGGHGDSAGRRASAISMAEEILAIGRALGPLGAVVAHSFGGVATSLALLAGLDAERAVFIATPTSAEPWLEEFRRAVGFNGALKERVRARLESRIGVSFDELRADSIAPVMDVPLLVIHDEDDDDVSIACAHELVEHWPDARLHVTTGLGHRRILRDPQVLGAVRDFCAAPTPQEIP